MPAAALRRRRHVATAAGDLWDTHAGSAEMADPEGGPSFTKAKADISGALATATVGLVSKVEFARRREELEKAAEEEGSTKEKKKKKKKKASATLSFAGEDDSEEEGGGDEAGPSKRTKKNPNVDTAFLPDKDREEAVQRRKAELAHEWEEKQAATLSHHRIMHPRLARVALSVDCTLQAAIKAELVEVTYSYWDGKGRRYSLKVPKGYTIDQFLNKTREQVEGMIIDFRRIEQQEQGHTARPCR